MPGIRFESFDGIAPVFDARQIRPEQGQIAENVDLVGGSLEPIKKMNQVATLETYIAKTIYNYNDEWLAWNQDVNVVTSPVFGERYKRIYYTGALATGETISKMKVRGYDADPVTGAEDTETIVERNVGVPAPASKVSVAAAARGSIDWYFGFTSYYEDPDGAIYQLTDNPTVNEVTLGIAYDVSYPAKAGTTPSTAKVMVYADVYSDAAKTAVIGRVYMNSSAYRNSSDAFVKGVKLKAVLGVVTSSPVRVTFSFDESVLSGQFYTTDRFYLMTYVNKWGEQGAASPVSDLVSVAPNQKAALTGLGNAAPAGYETEIYKKRIYRSAVSNTGTKYQFVAEIDVDEETYDDEKYDGELQEVLPSQYYEVPVDDLKGLVAMPQGFFAAFKNSTVYFSEPYQPHAWPSRYALTVEDPIVTMAVNGNTLFVLTEKVPVAITGSSPSSMSQSALPSNYSGTSLRGVLVMNDNIIYTSNVGLVAVRGFESILLTRRIYSKEQWQELNPSTMFLEEHKNRIHVFHDNGVLVMYPRAAITDFVDNNDITTVFGLVTSNRKIGVARNDHTTDTLYVAIASKLYDYSGGSENDRMKFKTKELYFDKPVTFSVVRVSADAYPLTLNIYTDKSLAQVVTVTDDKARKIPFIRKSKTWELEVVSDFTVRGMAIGNAMGDL